MRETFEDPSWNGRIWHITACGAASGLGGILGTLALAWAAGTNSALISMVENGTYTLASAVIICLYFGERPLLMDYLSGALILGSIVVAQISNGGHRPKSSKGDDAISSSESSDDADVFAGSDFSEHERDCNANVTSDARLKLQDADDVFRPESGSSEAGTSVVAPTRLRKRSVLLAACAGVLWGFGPLGKKLGVHDSPDGMQHAWTTCTYFIYMCCTALVPLMKVLLSCSKQYQEAFRDCHFLKLLAVTACCGFISGIGGLVSTFAFASAPQSGAVVSMIENGVYTVFGALLIAIVFRERPTPVQILSAFMVLAGIVISGFAKL